MTDIPQGPRVNAPKGTVISNTEPTKGPNVDRNEQVETDTEETPKRLTKTEKEKQAEEYAEAQEKKGRFLTQPW